MFYFEVVKLFIFIFVVVFSTDCQSREGGKSYFIEEVVSFGDDVKESDKLLIYNRLSPYFDFVENVDGESLEHVGLFVFDCVEEVCRIGFGSESHYVSCCSFYLYNNVDNWSFFVEYPDYVFEKFGHKDNIKYASLYEMKFNGYFIKDFGLPFIFFSRCDSGNNCVNHINSLRKERYDNKKYNEIIRVIEKMNSKTVYFSDMIRAYSVISD